MSVLSPTITFHTDKYHINAQYTAQNSPHFHITFNHHMLFIATTAHLKALIQVCLLTLK